MVATHEALVRLHLISSSFFPSLTLLITTRIVATMSFIVKRPFAVSSALKQFGKPSSIVRSFHSSPLKSSVHHKPAFTTSSFAQARTSLQNAFKRSYQTQGYAPSINTQGNLGQRLIYGGLLVGGTILATNFIFNRETREDGGMPLFEREYLNQTFMHTGVGIGIIGLAARQLHASGWSYRLMSMSPWAVIGVGLVASIGTMYGTMATSPDNYVQKYALWTGFNLTQAALLAPMMFMSPAILARAGLVSHKLALCISRVNANV